MTLQEENPAPSNHHQTFVKDLRKVIILLVIVIFLGIGYAARFVMTMDESIFIFYQLLTPENNCFQPSARQAMLNNIANLILTCNASFVALLYGILDTQFSQDLIKGITRLFHCNEDQQTNQ